jgi:hypothetical protein
MAVTLATAKGAPREGFDAWCAIGAEPGNADPARRIAGLGRLLEDALDRSRDEWLALGRELGQDPSAVLAHAPACATNASDLGLMLAWTRLVEEWATQSRTVLVVCDDPWLFRHLAARRGVSAGRAAPLWPEELRLGLRGFLARTLVAARVFLASLRFGRHVRVSPGSAWILSYAHPGSSADDMDAYFGELMSDLPALRRVLHVDGPLARAERLCASARTISLHGFGAPIAALGLWRARWRPRLDGPNPWLIRRAAAREGGTGQAAMIAWQIHCQERWLARAKPAVVAWPWENHSWERAFVRAARRNDVKTVGYQHATVGAREWNHAPGSNPDGQASLPDLILCNGPANRARLRAFGHEQSRLAIGGAWRAPAQARLRRDPAGPVFVALPSDPAVAAEMVAAIQPLARIGFRFVVRDHPMTPFSLAPGPGVTRAEGPLAAQKGVAAVLYAGTSVGLEAALCGLPTIRFRPENTVANDVLPEGIDLPSADRDELGRAVRSAVLPPSLDPGAVFAPREREVWRTVLGARSPA